MDGFPLRILAPSFLTSHGLGAQCIRLEIRKSFYFNGVYQYHLWFYVANKDMFASQTQSAASFFSENFEHGIDFRSPSRPTLAVQQAAPLIETKRIKQEK